MSANLEQVMQFMKDENINCLSQKEENQGTYFTWSGCDCCNDGLGATVEDCTGFNPDTKEIQEYKICGDCLIMATYGEQVER